jgi:transposase
MIRIDAAWLATAPLDMRAGTDTALARVVAVFGAAHPHTAFLFANKRANRIKISITACQTVSGRMQPSALWR